MARDRNNHSTKVVANANKNKSSNSNNNNNNSNNHSNISNNDNGGSSNGSQHHEEPPIITILTIVVKDQAGEETHFKIKDTTKLSEVFEAYAKRKGVQPTSLRLLWQGRKVCPCLTPHVLGMRDQDQIDCVSPVDLDAAIVIRVQDENGDETYFKIKQTTKMRKVFDKHSERRGVPVSQLYFSRFHREVFPDQTPVMMALRDGDKIDCRSTENNGADKKDGVGGGGGNPSTAASPPSKSASNAKS